MKNIVVIPIYRVQPDSLELISFRQCCKVLGTHPICIATYKELDPRCYLDVAKEYQTEISFEYFDKCFFEGITGYNKMMLSKKFYLRFSSYEYLLIYQLDAYVFSDQLDLWCAKGYDYIGAPWFKNFKSHEEVDDWGGVGNGGFSLRRIDYFIRVLGWKGPVNSPHKLVSNGAWYFPIYRFFYGLGYQNTINFIKRDITIFEDLFYCGTLEGTKLSPIRPNCQEAARFAFEKSPSYLMSITKQLPFGCHAWRRFEYEVFWKNHIDE